MTRALLILSLSLPSLGAFAAEYEGTMLTYKAAAHSANVQTQFRGPAAKAFFDHLTGARESRDGDQKIVVRAGGDMECTHYYGESRPYYECLFTMNEAGVVRGGYALE